MKKAIIGLSALVILSFVVLLFVNAHAGNPKAMKAETEVSVKCSSSESCAGVKCEKIVCDPAKCPEGKCDIATCPKANASGCRMKAAATTGCVKALRVNH